METLLAIVIVVLAVWAIFWIVDAIPVPVPISTIVKVVVAVAAVFSIFTRVF